jgi:hypothetical protein
MNDVRQKLIENIVEPAATGRSPSTIAGTILDVSESDNTCSVAYTKPDGRKINKYNVPVMLTNKSIIDWFPEKGETVLLQDKNDIVYITGPSYESYSDIRNKISLKNDLFSESFVDTLGGFLF